jgi:hypothetical protein
MTQRTVFGASGRTRPLCRGLGWLSLLLALSLSEELTEENS